MTAQFIEPDPDQHYKEAAENGPADACEETKELIWRLQANATMLDHAVGRWIDGDSDMDYRAYVLRNLRIARKDLAAVEAVLEGNFAQRMERNKIVLGNFEYTRRGGTKYVADDRALVSRIIDDALTEAQGELSMELVWTVIDRLDQARSIGYWRTGQTGLRALGIDPDDYGHREPGRRTVQIIDKTANEAEADA